MKKKKTKTKLKKFIIIFIIILFGVLVFFLYRTLRVKNIYVIGNKLIKEYEIIELADLKDYPYLYQVSTKKIEESINTNPLVNSVKIDKTLLGKITINITENRILFQEKDGKYALSNNEKIDLDNILGVPTLISDSSEMDEKLVKKMSVIDDDILKRISEIEYKPNDLDKERFMFYMDDGNYVYITLSKMNLINSYQEIYPSLEGKKGILYLDSGNHFEIKKDDNS